jgi:two-component system, NarL family, sensor histidine kinase DesK
MRRSGLGDRDGPVRAPVDRADSAERAGQAEASRQIVPPALWRLFVLIWLPFLYYPLLALALTHPAPLQLIMTLAGAAFFVGLYLYLALPLPFGAFDGSDAPAASRARPRMRLGPLALIALLAADILVLTLFASLDWLWFFIFVSITLGVRLPPRPAALAIAATTALTVALGAGALGWVYALRIALPVAVVGLGMIGVGRLVATIRELREAREEIARLAVAEERLRFARDLHDLLGHSLSTITLKNEVARSLIPSQPERAVRELADAIGVAREALREVRQAVDGYRQPTLPMEIRRARALLDAAGVTCSVDDGSGGAPPLSPALESVLAWAVREGVTNVVRHSGARHCAIAVMRQGDAVAVEISDDGSGGATASSESGRSGAGLRGLAERAAQVHGWVEAGPGEQGGFRLRVTAPLAPTEIELTRARASDHPASHSEEPSEWSVTQP